jgi:hypothetical protein
MIRRRSARSVGGSAPHPRSGSHAPSRGPFRRDDAARVGPPRSGNSVSYSPDPRSRSRLRFCRKPTMKGAYVWRSAGAWSSGSDRHRLGLVGEPVILFPMKHTDNFRAQSGPTSASQNASHWQFKETHQKAERHPRLGDRGCPTTCIRAPSTTWFVARAALRSEDNPTALRRVRTESVSSTPIVRGPATHQRPQQLGGAADKEHDLKETAIPPHLTSLAPLRHA